MQGPPVLADEAARLRSLIGKGILDTPPEAAFDAIVACAAAATGAPITLVSFVDDRRQWFKARHGLDVAETPKEWSFCAHGIAQSAPFVVPNADTDPRFKDNPFVRGAPYVKSYAGAQIVDPQGHSLGMVCAIDAQPRDWRSDQIELLQHLASLVAETLELRDQARRSDELVREVARLNGQLKSEKSLFESVERFANIGGWALDLANNSPAWTAQTQRIFEAPDGEPPSYEELIACFPPEPQSVILGAIERAKSEGRGWDLELPLMTMKGRTIWVRSNSTIIFQNGKPTKLTGVVQDISDHVREREQRAFSHKVNEIKSELQEIFLSGQVKEVFAFALNRMIEITASESGLIVEIQNEGGAARLKTLASAELRNWAGREDRLELVQRCLRQQAPVCEGNFVSVPACVGGQMVAILSIAKREGVYSGALISSIQPLLDRLGLLVVAIREREAREQSEASLAEALGQLSGFFSVAIDPLCLIDREGRFVRVNIALEKILGFTAEALEGSAFCDLVHPEDLAATRAALKAMEAGAHARDFVNRCRTRDGSYRNLEWRCALANGVIYAAARDITVRIAHEAEITASRDRAEIAAAAKSTFLANMSHEIRTPLNGLIGLAGALAATPLNARQAEMVALLRSSGETLVRLLSDILDMSKIEAGKLSLEIGAFELREAIETAAQVMRVRADDKGLDFEIRYGPNARGIFQGDVVRIRQIVSNLVSNAIKFTEQGGVTVEVDVADIEADESSVLTIAVIDSGIGFDGATAQRLFSRFEQADGSITRTHGGTGLGLSICRSLCDLMGGRIEAQAKPGEGSRFDVALPLERTMPLADFDRRAVEPKDTREANFEAFTAGAIRILLAEDHPVNQRVICLILEPLGVSVDLAKNGQEALDLHAVAHYDLILMDMQMPVLDGLEATRRIRERERAGAGRVPIVMLSANAMAEHVEQAIEAGCDFHVAKPVTPEALVQAVELALSLAVEAADAPNQDQQANVH